MIEEAYKVLFFYFYKFFKTNLKTKSKFIRRKIINTNVKKFLKGKLRLIYKNIL